MNKALVAIANNSLDQAGTLRPTIARSYIVGIPSELNSKIQTNVAGNGIRRMHQQDYQTERAVAI